MNIVFECVSTIWYDYETGILAGPVTLHYPTAQRWDCLDIHIPDTMIKLQ